MAMSTHKIMLKNHFLVLGNHSSFTTTASATSSIFPQFDMISAITVQLLN